VSEGRQGTVAGIDAAAAALRLQDVRKTYGTDHARVEAVAGVSVAFQPASWTAIMGPSGSGKTTLLQCAAGLAAPTSGQVWLGDTLLSGLAERKLATLRRLRMGFVFQDFNLLPALTGAENITLPVRLAGQREEPAWLEELLARTGIGNHAGRYPHELSGGQQQRIAISRALIARPDVVFADEPTGALDSRTSTGILTLLREAVDDLGQTVIMVTHDPAAAAWADRILLLRDGRVVDGIESPSMEAITSWLAAQEPAP
jgi:putative ABC transport system ATP-binding protein